LIVRPACAEATSVNERSADERMMVAASATAPAARWESLRLGRVMTSSKDAGGSADSGVDFVVSLEGILQLS
jgi:hypothetical protein